MVDLKVADSVISVIIAVVSIENLEINSIIYFEKIIDYDIEFHTCSVLFS